MKQRERYHNARLPRAVVRLNFIFEPQLGESRNLSPRQIGLSFDKLLAKRPALIRGDSYGKWNKETRLDSALIRELKRF
jgi:hypothetical protein